MPNQRFLNFNTFTKNWIQFLNDDIYVSILNIPGTHQSSALVGGPRVTVAQCQTWNIKSQLMCGIRYLDIRIKRTKDQMMPIYHGIIFQNAYFERDIFKIIKEFLQENPSEFIIMNLKSEGKAEQNSLNLDQILKPFINQNQNLIYQCNGKIPKVNELKGKIWILPYYNWQLNGFSLEKLKRNKILHHQDAFEANILVKKSKQLITVLKQFQTEILGNKERNYTSITSMLLNGINGHLSLPIYQINLFKIKNAMKEQQLLIFQENFQSLKLLNQIFPKIILVNKEINESSNNCNILN